MVNFTKVYFMNTMMDRSYAHTMYFATAAAQQEYFESRKSTAMTFENFSYQRKDQAIRVPAHVDSLLSAKVNYCMYQNTQYSNKWFYAFVTDIKYVDDGRTDVYIETDVMQTWMFDISILPSFVEREHAADDTIGLHTIDEMLEAGEFTVNSRTSLNYGKNLAVVIGVTEDPDGTNVRGNIYAGQYSGIKYYVFDSIKASDIDTFIASFQNDGAVVTMFVAPLQLVADALGKVNYGSEAPEWLYPYTLEINPVTNPEADGTDILFYDYAVQEFSDGKLDGYTPKNNKTLCFPYRYLLVSNNAGAAAIYKYERFFTTSSAGKKTIVDPTFKIKSVLTPGCSIRMNPCYYNGSLENQEEGINMGKFPILNWQSDIYTNWLTQNSVNIGVDLAVGAIQVVGGAAMTIASSGAAAPVGAGMMMGGAQQMYNTMSQAHQMSFVPPQAKGNTNAGDVITASGANTFQFYAMSVKAEYAKVIDDFFTMFGYKCNRVKIPAKNHRESFWYTKTIDANIIGGIPQDDLQKIKDCYNRGVTFWKTEAYFRNYSVSNNTV